MYHPETFFLRLAQTFSSLGRLLHSLFPGVPQYVFILLAIGLVAGLVALDNHRRQRHLARFAYRGIGLVDTPDILFLVEQGAEPSKKVFNDLRAFNTAAEVYRYVNQEFGETLFKSIHVLRADEEPEEFIRDEAATDDENIARLNAHMFPAASEMPAAQ